jgi:4-amino-4-deoxychorismate lyase
MRGAWINGRRGTALDYRDRGLQYADGVFETMRVHRRAVRLLDYHLERLYEGCRRLAITGPRPDRLRRELASIASRRGEGVLKLIVTRGSGPRGYRPSGHERCTRIVTLQALASAALDRSAEPARVRLCATMIGVNPALAGLKTLGRLESVMARCEWRDPRIWEGLMRDVDENIVCGTMSNLFLKRGSTLMTPVLDRCGVAGVMRRWVMETAAGLRLTAVERRIRWQHLVHAEEVFMTNAVAGVRSVGAIERGRERHEFSMFETAEELRTRLSVL